MITVKYLYRSTYIVTCASRVYLVSRVFNNIHEAASFCFWMSKGGKLTVHDFLYGQFFDDNTRKSWTVDSCGHSKKDYVLTTCEQFEDKWQKIQAQGVWNEYGKHWAFYEEPT